MTAVTEWPPADTRTPDQAIAAAETVAELRERISCALHALACQEQDALVLVRILASRSLADDDLALWWETYRDAPRACDALALGNADWSKYYGAEELGLGERQDTAEQMKAQEAEEALAKLAGTTTRGI